MQRGSETWRGAMDGVDDLWYADGRLLPTLTYVIPLSYHMYDPPRSESVRLSWARKSELDRT